jgi:RNA recognition motif-containing protein
MPGLFLLNVPFDCKDTELQQWIESHGFPVESLRIVRDLVSGASPAFGYVKLRDTAHNPDAIEALDGAMLKGRALQVKQNRRTA